MTTSIGLGMWLCAFVGYLIGLFVGRSQASKKSPNDAIRTQKLQEAFEQVAEIYDITRVWTGSLAPLQDQEREEMRNKLHEGWFAAREKLMKTQVWWPADLGKPLADFQLATLNLGFRPLTDEEGRMLDGRYRQLVQGFQRHLR